MPEQTPCDHGSTYTSAGGDMEFCLVCGELVRYFADDAQEWVEVQ
jgi:hypothetical protein